MTNNKNLTKLSLLLNKRTAGVPVTAKFLSSLGISPALAAHFCDSKYLHRLGRGAYVVAGDVLLADGIVKAVIENDSDMHFAGKTALALHHISHNGYVNPRLRLFGVGHHSIPEWASQVSYRNAESLFDFSGDNGKQLDEETRPALPSNRIKVSCSCKERAILELLFDVGKFQDYEETVNILEGVTNLRPDVMVNLLQRCQSQKVLRMFQKTLKDNPFLGFDVKKLFEENNIKTGSKYLYKVRIENGNFIYI